MFSRFVRGLIILAAFCLTSVIAGAVTSQEYYQAATGLYQQGKYDQAVQYYQAAIQLDPNNWQAYQGMGHAYFRGGKTQEALKAYDDSLRINPANTELKKFVDAQKAANPSLSTVAPAPTPVVRVKPGDKKMRFGVKVGGQLCNIVLSDNQGNSASYKSIFGPAFGACLQCRVSPHFSFCPEMMYVVKGAKYDNVYYYQYYYSSEVEEDSGNSKLNYLEVPILGRYYFGRGHRLNFVFGPSLSFLMSATEKATVTETITYTGGGSNTHSSSSSADLKPYLNSMDLGLVFGAGYELEHLTFDLRFDLGLSNLPKSGESGISETNQTFGLFVGYLF